MVKKSPDAWFSEYGESHQNRFNKAVHWVCVPAIAASLIGLLWTIPVPRVFQPIPLLNWATLGILTCLLFYLRLSVPLAIGMLLFSLVVVGGITLCERFSIAVWQVSVITFITAWVGQFMGHKVEGKKPSFFQDLQFLLIGPIWLLGFVYRRWGIRY